MARKFIVAVKPFLGSAVGEEVTLSPRQLVAYKDMIGRRLMDKAIMEAQAEAAKAEREAAEAEQKAKDTSKKSGEPDKNGDKK